MTNVLAGHAAPAFTLQGTRGETFSLADALRVASQGVEVIRQVLPARFNWPLFCVALALMAAPVVKLARELWAQREPKFSGVNSEEIET